MQRWRGNLLEIKILFQYLKNISISRFFAEWLKVIYIYIYHFESLDLEICNISFVWRHIRGKLPYTAVQESFKIFEEKYTL